MSVVDLAALPDPAIVEVLDFETVLAAMRADLLRRYPAAADVLDLESEPLVKLLEAFAYRELLFRQRVNEAARANLLAYATGTDLDHKGAFYNLPRQPGEADDRYRLRIQLRIAAIAGNGTAAQYRLVAIGASANVRDASVAQPVPGAVEVVLWLVDPAQAATTRAVVLAALDAEGARPLGVPVSVSVAQPRAIDVTAWIWRDPSAPADLVLRIATAFEASLAGYARLGRPVSKSWITTRLHAEGVSRVQYPNATTPAVNTALAANEYPVLGTLQLVDQGVE